MPCKSEQDCVKICFDDIWTQTVSVGRVFIEGVVYPTVYKPTNKLLIAITLTVYLDWRYMKTNGLD